MHTTCHQLKGEILMLERLLEVLSKPFHLVGWVLAILVGVLVLLTYAPVCYVITGDANLHTEWVLDWMEYHEGRLL